MCTARRRQTEDRGPCADFANIRQQLLVSNLASVQSQLFKLTLRSTPSWYYIDEVVLFPKSYCRPNRGYPDVTRPLHRTYTLSKMEFIIDEASVLVGIATPTNSASHAAMISGMTPMGDRVAQILCLSSAQVCQSSTSESFSIPILVLRLTLLSPIRCY